MATKQPQRSANQPVRSLRIGIILGGKIVEEKLMRPKASGKLDTISIGQSAKNAFAVPVDGLPRTWPLFQSAGGRYVLNFTPNMDGRLSDGQDIYTFDQLKAGPAQRRGPGFSLPLRDSARGKLTLGELTVLFQFVKAPPVQPRPMLPHSVRGTLADRIDPMLAVLMALSILFHAGFSYWLYKRDVATKTKLEMIADAERLDPERQAELFTIPVTPVVENVAIADAGTSTTVDPGPKKGGPKKGGDKKGGDGTPSDAAIAEAVEDSAVIRVLTGGSGGEGSRYSEMSDKDPGGDLEKGLKNAGKGDGKVTSRGEGGLGKGSRGPQSGDIGTGTGTGVGGPGDTGRTGGDKGEAKVESRTTFSDIDDIEGTLDPGLVAKTIRQRYLKGVKKCHEDLLKRDGAAGGRLEIEFTVGKAGKVVSAKVKGFDGGVDACVKALVTEWRFAVPKDEDGKPTTATFAMPFILKPGN